MNKLEAQVQTVYYKNLITYMEQLSSMLDKIINEEAIKEPKELYKISLFDTDEVEVLSIYDNIITIRLRQEVQNEILKIDNSECSKEIVSQPYSFNIPLFNDQIVELTLSDVKFALKCVNKYKNTIARLLGTYEEENHNVVYILVDHFHETMDNEGELNITSFGNKQKAISEWEELIERRKQEIITYGNDEKDLDVDIDEFVHAASIISENPNSDEYWEGYILTQEMVK